MFPLPPAGRIGLYVFFLLVGGIALHLAERVIVPLMIALLLATVLGPAAAWMHDKLKIRWSLACVTVIFGVILVNVLIFVVFSASVVRLANQLTNEQKILDTYKTLRTNLAKISPGPLDEDLFPANPTKLNEISIYKYVVDSAPAIFRNVSSYSADWMWQVVLVLFTTFFVLLEGRMLVRRVVAIFGPTEEVQTKAKDVLMEMAEQVRTYLVWRTIINLGMAIVLGIFFYWVGLSQAWTWAILLAILNYIPYFGPVLASIPPFLDAFISTEHPIVPFVIMLVYWIVIVIEGWLIVPLLMGRSMDLNATTVMLACLFWPLVWGPTGLFLAMPIMAAMKAILHSMPELRPWADLMSSSEGDAEDKGPISADTLTGKPSDGKVAIEAGADTSMKAS
jgi:AI-2 transport protein TqsA